MTKRAIFVRFQRAGIHRYPDAATDERLKDVSYLGSLHRHLFKFEVEIDVWHDDREIEFHQFLNWLESLYHNDVLLLDFKSCEMIGDDLLAQIIYKFPKRDVTITVSEDGECGARIYYKHS